MFGVCHVEGQGKRITNGVMILVLEKRFFCAISNTNFIIVQLSRQNYCVLNMYEEY